MDFNFELNSHNKKKKKNIMPITESKLLYREAFPKSSELEGLCFSLAEMDVSCRRPMKNINGVRVTVNYKKVCSRTRGPFQYCHHYKNNFSAI